MLGSPQQQASELQTFLNKLLKNNNKISLKQNSNLMNNHLQSDEFPNNCSQIKAKGVRGRKKSIPLSSTIALLNSRPMFNVLPNNIETSNNLLIEKNSLNNSTNNAKDLNNCDNILDANIEDDHLNVPSSSSECIETNEKESTDSSLNNKKLLTESSIAEASNSIDSTATEDSNDLNKNLTAKTDIQQNFLNVPNENNLIYLNYLKMLLASAQQQKQQQQQHLFNSNNSDSQNSLSIVSTPPLNVSTASSNRDSALNSFNVSAAVAANAIFPPGLSMFGFNIEQVFYIFFI